MKKKTICLRLWVIVILSTFVFTGCQKNGSVLTSTGFYFDTVIAVTIYDPSKEYTLDACMQLAAYYENLLSTTIEGSDIWNINHANGSAVQVDEETIFLLEKAIYYAELSGGLFDPTIAPLSSLWDFSSENEGSHVVPSSAEIDALLPHINYKNIVLYQNTVTLTNPNSSLDLGGIAKGYIADKMKEYLLQEDITSAIINLGGNVLTIGAKPDGSDFVIGIQKPFEPAGTALTTVSVKDSSVVTSGIYERYFEQDDTLYHHILTPANGYPVQNELASVTICTTSSTDADALSTICLLLGYEEAKTLIDSIENTEALFVAKEGTIYYTDGFPR